jgi:cyclopropane-fatty-acyl-phospholipid synthase
MTLIALAEKGWMPDPLIRAGIRHLCKDRLNTESKKIEIGGERARQAFFDTLRISPIAIETDAANQQHYEVPTEFYQQVLGKHLKYSACWWNRDTSSLDEAEKNMLKKYAQRAELENGQEVLDLGCGWGSLSLWLAGIHPKSRITAVSNSATQRAFIEQQAISRGLDNLQVITSDINDLQLDKSFDRIVSIEMLEHVRNYDSLFARIGSWLKPDGIFFAHIFCHKYLAYPFETEGDANWMGRYFFTGGLMPSIDTFEKVQQHLKIEKQWQVNGDHYAKTAEAWLDNTDLHQKSILSIFAQTYGEKEAALWLQRWRMFFMSCAELFGFKQGDEWLVNHYRFRK